MNVINGFVKESIVISCGGGCAISYSPTNITPLNSKIKVLFDVIMYEDQVETENYEETYVFFYDDSRKLTKIQLDGEDKNILETLSEDAQQSFTDFGNNLMKNKNVDFSRDTKTNIVSEEKHNICKLPFDFQNYYNICFENENECEKRYVAYNYPENKNILAYYGIKESPTKIFLLPKQNTFQPIILAYTDSDIEGYYLNISEKGKVISSLQIGKMDGETITSFLITEDFQIVLYSQKDSDSPRTIISKYKLQKNGLLSKI